MVASGKKRVKGLVWAPLSKVPILFWRDPQKALIYPKRRQGGEVGRALVNVY